MSKILCATRGGEASIRPQDAAIARAKSEGKGLIFFLVMDVEVMVNADYGMRTDIIQKAMAATVSIGTSWILLHFHVLF